MIQMRSKEGLQVETAILLASLTCMIRERGGLVGHSAVESMADLTSHLLWGTFLFFRKPVVLGIFLTIAFSRKRIE